MKRKTKVAVDLFSGAGGVSCGLKRAGINVKVAVEIWDIAADTYEENLEKVVIRKDIKTVSGREILRRAEVRKGQLFLLAGCPPCQGFSSHQKQKLGEEDERNLLAFEYVRIVNEIKPLFILMENVPGMKKESIIFKNIIKELENCNYKVMAEILNAADYGVPQTRKRLVLHGVRMDIYMKMQKKGIELGFPIKTHNKVVDDINKGKLKPWRSVKEAIIDLPKIKAGERHLRVPNHYCSGLSEKNLKRIEIIRAGGGNRTALPEHMWLECHKKETSGYKDVYGIMDWDKPAPTITGGCLSFTKGRFGHPEQNRAISAREAARLQSFEDSFVFKGNRQDMALQIGNAVPVLLAEASGRYFAELGNKLRIIDL